MDRASDSPRTAETGQTEKSLELSELRQRLEGSKGPEYWRSLEELAGTPEFEELLHREFPQQAGELPEGVDRRRFLQLAAASLALGGLTACTRQPLEKIVPYVQQPELLIPGKPLYYASTMTLDGYARPLLVESHMGRPTKIEGNPQHVASRGAADLFSQASVLDLYDPERSQVVNNLGRIRTWQAFESETRSAVQALDALGGARIRILTHTVTSPSLGAAIDKVLEAHPKARWHQYTPVSRDAQRQGLQALFGQMVSPRYHLENADVILGLDSDFLTSGPDSLANARDFADRRRVHEGHTEMSRLYTVESSPTNTGTLADHRLSGTAAEIASLVTALGARLGVPGAIAQGELTSAQTEWISAVAEDLETHAQRSLVIPGDCVVPEVQTLAHAINHTLGSVGSTVDYLEPVEFRPEIETDSLRSLVDDMNAGEVDVLLILGCNPAFNTPTDLQFMTAMNSVSRRVHLGLYEDETAEFCHWHLPQAHFLESWGDARAYDGSVCLTQPLIEPLYDGRTAAEILSIFAEDQPKTGLEILHEHWRRARPEDNFDKTWRQWLHDGFITDSQADSVPVTVVANAIADACSQIDVTAPMPETLEIVFRPDPTLYDGRYCNNGWLQECPKPLSKLTWDNALLIAPTTAKALGVSNSQKVEITIAGRTLEMPAWILPGHPEKTATAHLGYGRRRTGQVGSGTGFNTYLLRGSDTMWTSRTATVRPGQGSFNLVSTQLHSNIDLESREAEKRHLVRVGTLHEFEEEPEFAQHMAHSPTDDVSMFPMWEYSGHAWGLNIDLSACTGCNACVLACQAENNIPIVGKEQVEAGREMHWIRIDRYYQGDLEDPQIHHQPVMCMHCEQAPCEPVCPVQATVHSDEGLNDMVYNRCVGTRYCSNNCPYKVRRFNFLKYNDFDTPILKMLRNPDVTVRSRGVMEKCTYCVQRISHVRIESEKENRPIRDGEIQTACQQTCPSQAIVFGDINEDNSAVAKLKSSPLNYGILEEVGTRPRTSYLAKIRNPNPKLEKAKHDTA
jgi:molybdopterin-containing oxidoreductase family iron-sulfur binding subunit